MDLNSCLLSSLDSGLQNQSVINLRQCLDHLGSQIVSVLVFYQIYGFFILVHAGDGESLIVNGTGYILKACIKVLALDAFNATSDKIHCKTQALLLGSSSSLIRSQILQIVQQVILFHAVRCIFRFAIRLGSCSMASRISKFFAVRR